MVCKVNVFLLMCKLFWQKIGETYWWPLDCRLKAIYSISIRKSVSDLSVGMPNFLRRR